MNIEQYGQFAAAFGLRRNRKEKTRFIENLKPLFENYGYKMTVYEDRLGLRKINHVVFGDPGEADYVFVCGYDTTERIILGDGRYWPLEESRNKSKTFVNLTIYLVLAIVLVVVGVLIIRQGFTFEGFRKIVMIITGTAFIYVANRVSQGLPNRTTFAKTSSIFLLFELASAMKGKKYSFVFADYGAFSRIGLDFLSKNELVNDRQTVIYVDCMSDGDRLLIAHGPKAGKAAEIIKEKYKGKKAIEALAKGDNHRFTGLDNWIVLCNVYQDEKDDSLYVPNVRTDEDLTIDTETIDNTVNALKGLGDAK